MVSHNVAHSMRWYVCTLDKSVDHYGGEQARTAPHPTEREEVWRCGGERERESPENQTLDNVH